MERTSLSGLGRILGGASLAAGVALESGCTLGKEIDAYTKASGQMMNVFYNPGQNCSFVPVYGIKVLSEKSNDVRLIRDNRKLVVKFSGYPGSLRITNQRNELGFDITESFYRGERSEQGCLELDMKELGLDEKDTYSLELETPKEDFIFFSIPSKYAKVEEVSGKASREVEVGFEGIADGQWAFSKKNGGYELRFYPSETRKRAHYDVAIVRGNEKERVEKIIILGNNWIDWKEEQVLKDKFLEFLDFKKVVTEKLKNKQY